MRLRLEHSLATTCGCIGICDGQLVPPGVPDTALDIEVEAGTYHLYRGVHHELLVLDGAPLVLRTRSRTDLERVASLRIESGTVAMFDGAGLDVKTAQAHAAYLAQFSVADVKVWIEERDLSESRARGFQRLLGVGPRVHLLLAGPDADHLLEIERQLAQLLRTRDPDREAKLAELGRQLVAIHLDGSTDRRVKTLAQALKLKLPRRTTKPQS